ncbi:hypothetical protein, partial [Chromobacterium phragmitis]
MGLLGINGGRAPLPSGGGASFPPSGEISLRMVNERTGRAWNSAISMSDPLVKSLAGGPPTSLSGLRGKGYSFDAYIGGGQGHVLNPDTLWGHIPESLRQDRGGMSAYDFIRTRFQFIHVFITGDCTAPNVDTGAININDIPVPIYVTINPGVTVIGKGGNGGGGGNAWRWGHNPGGGGSNGGPGIITNNCPSLI